MNQKKKKIKNKTKLEDEEENLRNSNNNNKNNKNNNENKDKFELNEKEDNPKKKENNNLKLKDNKIKKSEHKKKEKYKISIFEQIYNKMYNNNNEKKYKPFPPKKNNFSINNSKKTESIFSFAKFKSTDDDFNHIQINISSKKQPKERKLIEYKKEINSEMRIIKENNDSELYYDMNDDELNSLEYEQALIYDKRNFFQYY